jgi:hypothetical protein
MTVWYNLWKGFGTVKAAARLILFLYVVNLAFALVLAVPLHRSLAESIGRSDAGDRLAKGFDYVWWEEYRDRGRGLSRSFGPSVIGRGALLNNLEGLVEMRFVEWPSGILLVLLVFLVTRAFLAGGTLDLFRRQTPRFAPRPYLEAALTRFPTFLGLMLLSWFFFGLIGFLLRPWLRGLVERLASRALTEVTGFWAGLGASAVVWALLLVVQMIFDYARIKSVLRERRSVLRSFLDGSGFVLRHPAATLGLAGLLFLGGAGLSAAYVLAREAVGQGSVGGAFLGFALQQAFLLGLIGLRCWAYAGQMHLARYFEP